jgi:antitoxin component YwqK of YwqJK toxin-antitoxin module
MPKNQGSEVYDYFSPPKDVLALESPVPQKPKEGSSAAIDDAMAKSAEAQEKQEKEAAQEAEKEKQEEAQEKEDEEQEAAEEEQEKKDDEAEEAQDKIEAEKDAQEEPAYPLLFRDGKQIDRVEGTGVLDIVDEDGGKMTVPIQDGKKNGQALLFDETGVLFAKLTYVDDVLHGPGQYMYSDGKTLQAEFNYENDVLSGPFVAWSENGLKQSEGTYKNNVIHGDYLVYDLEEEVTQIQEYKDGLQDGETRTYMPKTSGGKLYKTEHYEKGVRKWEKLEKI